MKKIIEYIKKNWLFVLLISGFVIYCLLWLVNLIFAGVDYYHEKIQTKEGCFELGAVVASIGCFILFFLFKFFDEKD